MNVLGTDKEAQLLARSINLPTGQIPISPTQIVRQGSPSRTLLGETLSNVPNVSFDKIDEFGRPILNSWQKLIQQGAGANIPSAIPATVPARGVNYAWNPPGIFGAASQPAQTAPNLEEEYQRTHRPKSAARGGPRAPGEGLFNPISPSI